MQIRSASITNFAVLRGPIAVTFGPGLNIIHGPNETGKTTLLRAIRTALTMKATVSGKAAKAIQPRDGSFPEVEVVFERGGSTYTVRKLFRPSTGTTALQISDAAGSQQTLNGDDAEQRLREVLGVEDPGRKHGAAEHQGIWPLLWVEQGRSGDSPSDHLTDTGRAALSMRLSALSGEVLAGDQGERVLALAKAEYERYFTASGKESNVGSSPLKQARDAHEAATAQHAELLERDRQHAETLAQYAQVSRTLAELAEQLPALAERAEAAAAVEREVAKLQERTETLRAEAQVARLTAEQAAARHAERGTMQRTITAMAADLEARQARHAADQATAQSAAAERVGLVEALTAARDRQASAERRRQWLQAHADWQTAARKHDEMAALITKARGHQKACQTLTASIDSESVTADVLDHLRELDATRRQAEAAVQALAARLEIAALTELEITIDGETKTLVPNAVETLSAALPRVVQIGDVARLRVTPGGADLTQRREALEAAERDLQQLLATHGVADIAAARTRLQQRQSLEQELELAGRQYRELAPKRDSMERLETELERLLKRRDAAAETRDRLRGDDDWETPPDDNLGEVLDAATHDSQQASTAVREAEVRLQAFDLDAGKLQGRIDADAESLRERAEALATQRSALALAEERQGDAAALEAAAAAAAQSQAERDADLAAAEAALAAHAPEQVARNLERSRKAYANAQKEAETETRREIELATQLASRELVGLHEQLAQAESDVATTAAALARQERRAAVAKLLYDTLQSCRDAARSRYLQPLQEEVGRLLQRLFPAARVEFDEAFAVTALSRDGRGEDTFDVLSGGSQEQLGVLVRLAMARVLAREEPLTLMLDDAFVATDDARYDQMASLLDEAAEDLQIIMATCHWSRYRTVGADAAQVTDLAALLQAAT